MSIRENVESKLFYYGFTQWRYDVGARRGEFSNSYRNETLDFNVILYGCTYEIRSLQTGETLVNRGDQLELLRGLESGKFI